MSRRLACYFLGEDPAERRFMILVNLISATAMLLAHAA